MSWSEFDSLMLCSEQKLRADYTLFYPAFTFFFKFMITFMLDHVSVQENETFKVSLRTLNQAIMAQLAQVYPAFVILNILPSYFQIF